MSKRGNGETEPWVVASRLRDHLLLPKERKDPLIWRKVKCVCKSYGITSSHLLSVGSPFSLHSSVLSTHIFFLWKTVYFIFLSCQ